MNPVIEYAKEPFKVVFEHPLFSAFASGVDARASAIRPTVAKVLAIVLRFMIISFEFIGASILEEEQIDRLFSFTGTGGSRGSKRPCFLNICGESGRGWANHQPTH
jgi:hypothetical protein